MSRVDELLMSSSCVEWRWLLSPFFFWFVPRDSMVVFGGYCLDVVCVLPGELDCDWVDVLSNRSIIRVDGHAALVHLLRVDSILLTFIHTHQRHSFSENLAATRSEYRICV